MPTAELIGVTGSASAIRADCSNPDPVVRNACWGDGYGAILYDSLGVRQVICAVWGRGHSARPILRIGLRSCLIWREKHKRASKRRDHLSHYLTGTRRPVVRWKCISWQVDVGYFPAKQLLSVEKRLAHAIKRAICGNVAGFESYPYRGVGDLAKGYYSKVWDDVHHGATLSFWRFARCDPSRTCHI